MNYTPVNAAPMTISLGVNDRSIKAEVYEAPARPIHYPLQFIWAADGPTTQQSVAGAAANQLYGTETFDLRSKFANHSTVFTKMFMEQGNTLMIKRMRPKDAPPPANLRIYADVLKSQKDEFERDPVDGSIKLDNLGNPKTTGQLIEVTEVKYVVEHIAPVTPNDEVNTNFGSGTKVPGTYDDGNGTVSEKIPLFDFEVPFFGSTGNLRGVKLWAPNPSSAQALNTGMINQGVYPFFIAFMKKATETATPRAIETNYSELQTEFCLKPGFVDANTDSVKYMGDVVLDNYRDLTANVAKHGPFGKIHIYQDNIDHLLKDIFTAEKAQTYANNELTQPHVKDTDFYLVNLFGATGSNGVPYQTFRLSSSTAGGVRLTENTTMLASGGGDGTMTEEEFGDLVISEIQGFNDLNSSWQDFVDNPCSFFWDSGYSLKVKKELGKFIGIRKNTMVVLSTHVAGSKQLTAAEESSMGIALLSHVRAYPESDYFGTPAFRAAIVSRSGKVLNSQWRDYVPVTYSLAKKISRFAGAGNGKFKSEFSFDRTPTNFVDDMNEINVPWVPAAARNKDWDAGLLWVEKISQRQFYFPATRTIYNNDTSVLMSILTALCCIECETVGLYAQKYFSGGNYTKGELKKYVEEWVRDQMVGKFAERFIISPEVTFTEADDRRGYSWRLTIRIGAGNMKTVQTLVLETYRKEDMPKSDNALLA